MKEIWKIFSAAVLFMVTLTFLTMEKVSYIWTLRAVADPNISLTTGYCVVLVLLLSPYVITFLQCLWNVSFLTKCLDTRLPPLHNILLGVLSSVLEAACLVWFTCLVAPCLPVFVVLPAMSGVLAVSAMAPWLNSPHGAMYNFDESAESTLGRRLLATLCTIGPSTAAAILYMFGSLHWLRCLLMVGSVVLLAVMWSPGVLFRTFSVDGEVSHNCRRLMLFYVGLKIVFVPFFLGVNLLAFSPTANSIVSTFYNFHFHFTDLSANLLLPLLMNIIAGMLSHCLVFLSLAFCQPLCGLLLPSLLSTASSIGLCVTVIGPYIYQMDEMTYFGQVLPLLLSGVVLVSVWASGYVLRTPGLLRGPDYLFMSFEDLMLDYGWCAGFSEQRRLLAYCVNRYDVLQHASRGKKSRVYVCTTMYREADYEMERLLLSLQKLSGSKALEDVYMEAHIFMDNGINDSRLGDFAKQLIGLMLSRLGVDLAECRGLLTPYGLQLTSTLPGDMPLFVHFKDPSKVKAKKRWSQCMYINYIMNFRKVLWEQDNSSHTLLLRKDSGAYYVNKKCSVESAASSRSLSSTGVKAACLKLPAVVPYEQSLSLDHRTDSHSDNGSLTSTSVVKNVKRSDMQVDGRPVNQTGDGDGIARNHTLYEFNFDPEDEVDDDHTYILATDADMDFGPEAVADLLYMCNSDHRLGAACGRTHPVGKRCSSIVWHQIFEYAKDFWMIKSAQNVIGSVMCCPGCFSLYRASALRQVMDKYATPTNTPFTVYVKDTGEDRWMATLMMINGWRLRYSAVADNTTYCPDSCQEFFKQRRRWILSDIANLVLVVQNIPSLLRNNHCFSLVYVLYLLNMFINNVITPGTAIVMITAGMDLVFDVPYIYTTPPLAAVVYVYAYVCTQTSPCVQTALTSLLTLLLGSVFASVAIWGSYKIVHGMINEISEGNFQFQQHYIILMLTVSLLYAAIIHPRECHQIAYGLAYLFIFPAMHLLLPIYSIANIVDQSWGTRDTQKAVIPMLKCLPALKKMVKFRKTKIPMTVTTGTSVDIQQMITAIARPMAPDYAYEREENAFWEHLRQRLLGNDVNTGLQKDELAERLKQLRNRSLLGLMAINAVWLAILSYFYVGIDSPLSRLNLYGLISGALYGFTLLIQMIGMTVCRLQYVLHQLARFLYGDNIPFWVRFKHSIHNTRRYQLHNVPQDKLH